MTTMSRLRDRVLILQLNKLHQKNTSIFRLIIHLTEKPSHGDHFSIKTISLKPTLNFRPIPSIQQKHVIMRPQEMDMGSSGTMFAGQTIFEFLRDGLICIIAQRRFSKPVTAVNQKTQLSREFR